MTLSPQWLDELRSRLTLSAVIGRHVKVQRAGREYKACCPFHHEKTPSFTINDDKGFYHCFGCGAHGDAIRFLTDHRGLGFMDAVKELAGEAGMSVPAPDPRAAQAAAAQASLHEVCQAAQDWFVAQLRSPAAAEARGYLERRGLRPETLERFGFGFAPDSRDALKKALGALGEDRLIEAGLLISVEGKPSYDRFRGRIMIPIRDPRGRVIAFGGRIVSAGEPKYLNSPDTPLFDKGRTLFNLDRAAAAVRQRGRIIVVEGYMDAIALAQAGIDEAVAPLGTALTEAQIERLWRMAERPLLCFDGDNAGQRAALRAAMRALPMLRPGCTLGFVTMPAGEDPDDVVRRGGAAAFEALADRAESLFDRLLATEIAAAPLDSPEMRAGLKQRLLAHAERIGDPDIRALYARDFRSRFSELFFAPTPRPERGTAPGGGFSAKAPGRFAGRDWPPPAPSAELKALSRQDAGALLRRGIVLGLIHYPELIARHVETLAELRQGGDRWGDLIGAMIAAAERAERLDTASLLTILGEMGRQDAVAQLDRDARPPYPFCRAEGDAAARMRAAEALEEAIALSATRPRIEAALQAVTRRFEERFGSDGEDAAELFEEQQRLKQQRDAFDQRLIELADRDGTAQ